MPRRHRWVWVLLFILVVAVLGTLATGWNFVLVRDYRRFFHTPMVPPAAPIYGHIWGTLGFISVVCGIVIFFIKLQKEMKLNQLQSEFIATVSHELKTPIATLDLTSSLLRQDSLTREEAQELWKSHEAELKRLKEEVEALLEAARWQSGKVRLKKSQIDLEAWLHEALGRWRNMLGPQGIIERQGEPLPCRIAVDLKLFNLITDNLIDNARKFSREQAPQVIVRSTLSGDRWQLQFQDEGWGFDPADSKKIFKRFFRSRTDAPYAISGTGLGLYLAASASQSMGLVLTGVSRGTGKGAVFTLEGKGNVQ